jgi:hypothetical protein
VKKKLAVRLGGAAAVVAMLLCGAGYATTYAAFNITANGRGQYAAGTVYLTDNSGGVALPGLSSALPGAVATGCVRVTYGGSLPARVRLYVTPTGTITPYLTARITRGTVPAATTFPSCTGFTPDAPNYAALGAGVMYDGPLAGLPTSGPTGLLDPTIATPEVWTTGEAHVYRIDITLSTDPAGAAKSGTVSAGFFASNV